MITCGRRGTCSPRDTVNRHTGHHGNHFRRPNAIGKLHMCLPSSFLLDLFLSAVWGHYGVYDLNTIFKSLLFLWPGFVLMFLPPCLRLPNSVFMRRKSGDKSKELICGLSDASASTARFLACPIITNVFHEAPSQTNTLWGSSTRAPSCHGEVRCDRDRLSRFISLTSQPDSLLHVG